MFETTIPSRFLEAEQYTKMLQKADFQEHESITKSPSAQDMVDMLIEQDWTMLDVVESMHRYYVENFTFADVSLKPLLLYMVEYYIYNKHWNGEDWVTLEEQTTKVEKGKM